MKISEDQIPSKIETSKYITKKEIDSPIAIGAKMIPNNPNIALMLKRSSPRTQVISILNSPGSNSLTNLELIIRSFRCQVQTNHK